MTADLDALLAANPPEPEPARSTATPRRCRRHEWEPTPGEVNHVPGGSWTFTVWRCARCGRPRDEATSRRGRTNRSRGNAIEREVCRKLGIARVGHHGTETDGGTSEDWIRCQVKSGGAYPARIDALLRALPVTAGQLRAVVHATADGAGHRRRSLITLDLDEFASWFGAAKPREEDRP